MKTFLLATAVLAMAVLVGCAKKDEGGGGAPGCPPQQYAAPAFGGCSTQEQCPTGLVVNVNERSMCADPRTGQNVMPQSCGAGFFLTADGCYKQGDCQDGRALRGDVCVKTINVNSSMYQTGYSQQGMGWGQPGYGYGQQQFGQPGMFNGGGFGGGYGGGMQTVNPFMRPF